MTMEGSIEGSKILVKDENFIACFLKKILY